MTGIEPLVVGVGAELLKSAAVAGLNFFRNRTKDDEQAKHEAKDTLGQTRANLETALEEIIHSSLSSESRDRLSNAIEESIEQPPIAEARARVDIARYTEVPVYQIAGAEEWMRRSDLMRTAANHAWVENRLMESFKLLGYAIDTGRELNEGAARFWVDIEGKSALPPFHKVKMDIICSPPPIDHRVAALLYDMETSNLLQEGDWFLLATHSIFSEFSRSTIIAARNRVNYIVNRVEGNDIADIVEAQDDPAKLGILLRSIVEKG
jgi:hypothetical protein